MVVPRDEWEVLIHDHLPGYITWERYEANLRRLAAEPAPVPGPCGRPGEGDSLLAGLVSCGRCGRRMMVAYTGKEGRLRYSCQRGALDYAEPLCQSLAGGPLDELVGRQVLLALEPAALELSLRAVGDVAGGSGTGWTGSGGCGWSGPGTRRSGRPGSTRRASRRTGWSGGSWSGGGSRR